MKIQNYHIEYADPVRHLAEIHLIRAAVFTGGGNPEANYANDADCRHVLARAEQGEAIGTGRLAPDGSIHGLAVIEPWRNQGVGSAMLNSLLNQARTLGLTDLKVNVPVTCAGFFQKAGFMADYDRLTGDSLSLPLTLKLLTKPPRHNTGTIPGKTAETNAIETLAQTAEACLQIIRQARRKLVLLTPDLEAGLYGQKAILEAFKAFATGNRDNLAQIILLNPVAVNGQGHGLVELAQKLPSKFVFRQPVEVEDMQYPSAFIANDRDGYLFRLDNNRYQGRWSQSAPARNRQLSEEFDRIWQRSLPSGEFRVLSL